MRAVAPRTGADEMTIGENQPEVMPLTICVYDYADARGMLARFTFSPEERQRVAAGEDLYVMQLFHPGAQVFVPMHLQIGEGSLKVTGA